MNRAEKIAAIRKFQAGVPLKYALNPDDYAILKRNDWEDVWFNRYGDEIPDTDVKKYLLDSILLVSVAKGYDVRDFCKDVKQ